MRVCIYVCLCVYESVYLRPSRCVVVGGGGGLLQQGAKLLGQLVGRSQRRVQVVVYGLD